MAIDTQTVKRIAFLSRLKIEDDKIAATEEELNEVDTAAVEPLVSVNENNITMRRDEVTDVNLADEVLANAPMKEYGYFAVPKVVE